MESKAIYYNLQLKHTTMRKPKLITLFYKVFIITIIFSQSYILIFDIINFWSKIINLFLTIYFIFRYYLINRLSKKANNMNISLNELLKKNKEVRCNVNCDCKFCSCGVKF